MRRPRAAVNLEVRCCCDPGRLLGSLPVPDGVDVRDGERVTFVLQPGSPWTVNASRLREPVTITRHQAERLTLPIAWWSEGRAFRGGALAFKSNDTPIETLRRIAGFVEARLALAPDPAAGTPDVGSPGPLGVSLRGR